MRFALDGGAGLSWPAAVRPRRALIEPMSAPGGLPTWCDGYLAPAREDFFASRAWFDTTLAASLPPGGAGIAVSCGHDGPVLLPMRSDTGTGHGWGSLSTPYTLSWRPLWAEWADEATARTAGRTIGRSMRGRPPAKLEALDLGVPRTAAFLDGMRAAGIAVLPYAHFGNWHQPAPDGGWDAYLGTRPATLRATIQRKGRLAEKTMRFQFAGDHEGRETSDVLEAVIAAYRGVYARSWKRPEPFPDFDAALVRAAAAQGVLRAGVLWAADGRPAAAQYWIVSGGCATLLKLAHDEAFRPASPGTVLTAAMVRRLLAVDRVRALDLGRGDDPYKQLWARCRRQRSGVLLASPWHPAGLAAIARQAASAGRRTLRTWLRAITDGPDRGDMA